MSGSRREKPTPALFYFDTLKNVRVQEKCKGSKGKCQRIKVTVQGDGIVGKPRGFHDSLQQDGHSRDVQGRHRNMRYNERKALGLGRVPFSFGIEKTPCPVAELEQRTKTQGGAQPCENGM